MATLIVEDGTAKTNANSYATAAEGDTYHELRLYSTTWDAASTADKEKALMWATRLLDEQVAWPGHRVDYQQALLWPRHGVPGRDGDVFDSDEVPAFLKDATAEFARQLLAEDRTADDDTAGFDRLKVGPIEIDINSSDRAGVLPDSVAAILRPYTLNVGDQSMFARVVRT